MKLEFSKLIIKGLYSKRVSILLTNKDYEVVKRIRLANYHNVRNQNSNPNSFNIALQ